MHCVDWLVIPYPIRFRFIARVQAPETIGLAPQIAIVIPLFSQDFGKNFRPSLMGDPTMAGHAHLVA